LRNVELISCNFSCISQWGVQKCCKPPVFSCQRGFCSRWTKWTLSCESKQSQNTWFVIHCLC